MNSRRIAHLRLRPAGFAGCAIAGAVLGFAWDRIWVATGAIRYPGADAFGPWWVAVAYGLPLAVATSVAARFGDLLPGRTAARRAAIESLYVAGLYALTGVLDEPAVAAIVLVGLLLARTAALQETGSRNPGPVLSFVVGATALHAALASAGLVTFARPGLFGIPVWLLLLLMCAVPFFVRFCEAALWLGGARAFTTDATLQTASADATPQTALPKTSDEHDKGGPEARPPSKPVD